MRVAINGLNLMQPWKLFAYNLFFETRFIVVDAETADGRHIDVFTGKPPRTEFDGPISREGFGEHWLDYLRRVYHYPEYHAGLARYIQRYGDRTGRPGDRIVAFTVGQLFQSAPEFGSHVQGKPRLRIFAKWARGGVRAWPAAGGATDPAPRE
jgi:hypothetical protein